MPARNLKRWPTPIPRSWVTTWLTSTSSFGEAWIATLPMGLTSAAFGPGSVSFGNSPDIVNFNVTVAAVPEPGTLCLLATALAVFGGCAIARRRRAA